MSMIDGALVLEGGSLRCMFTAGVLDEMLEQQLELAYVNGVSAGSLSGMNYVSKQIGRTRDVNIKYVNDKRYLGVRNLLLHGGIFNFNFLFGELSELLIPFDSRAFFSSGQRYEAVATNCSTGLEEYFEKGKEPEIMRAAAASCSMPLLSDIVVLNDQPYLDGGIAEPIAYHRAMEQGFDKVVVILTRQHGYQKQPHRKAMLLACERRYRNYPELVKRICQIPEHYNQMQEELDELERDGKVFLIRPEKPIGISRVEKDTDRLMELYEEGRRIGRSRMPALKKYLEIEDNDQGKTNYGTGR